MRVVPHNTEAAYSIQVHILETEVGNVQMFPFIIRFRAVVSHTYRERSVEEPVLGENPVVSIAAGYVHIAVFHLAEHQRTVYLGFRSSPVCQIFIQLFIYKIGQFIPVHLQFMLRVTDSQKHGTGTSPLHRTLRIGGRIREAAMVEDVIKIESLDARFETVERSLADRGTIDVLTQIHPLNMIVISRLSPEQVYSQQTAVEAQVKLLFISVVIPEINVLQVERITQKHPSPAQIRPQAVRRIRREGNALSFAVSERIFLVGIGVLQHHRIIVMLVFYISRIRTVEFSEEPGEHISHLMEEGFAMALFHEAVLGIGHEHRLVEERSQHGRIHGLPCPCRSADKGTDKSYYTETSLHNLRSNPDDDFVKNQFFHNTRSSTQLTAVAETLVQSHFPIPCRC